MDWIRDHLWETWLALSIGLGVAEMFSLDLILAMLAAGAVIGMVAALLGLPVFVQVLAALAASVAMLAFVRPAFVKRLHGGPELSLGHGKLVGTRGLVTEEITGLARRADQGGRRDLDGPALRREPADRPGETVEILADQGRDGLRPPRGDARALSHRVGPTPAPPDAHHRSGETNADSLVRPVPARRPVRRRHARQDGQHRAPGARRHRRALRQVQGRRCRPDSTSSCRSSTRCATSSTCASRS